MRLRAARGFAQREPRASELRLLHRWLHRWAGVGQITARMFRQGWDLQLTEYGDDTWRATFYVTGQAQLDRRRVGVGADAVASSAAGGLGSA